MIWIAAFLICGLLYRAVKRLKPTYVMIISAAILAIYALLIYIWHDNLRTLDDYLMRSLQRLTGIGIDDAAIIVRQDVPRCFSTIGSDNGFENIAIGLIVLLVVLVIALICFGLGMAAVLGLPFGVVLTGFGAMKGLFNSGRSKPLSTGLYLLTIGLGAIAATGVIMRLLSLISSSCG